MVSSYNLRMEAHTKQPRLKLVPCPVKYANGFVEKLHRHHRPTRGGLFALTCVREDLNKVCGVIIVSRPVARMLQDGWTVEVVRCCTDGTPNSCSMLYGAAWKASRALGYHKIVTYTLPQEGGASLRGAGWSLVDKKAGGRAWQGVYGKEKLTRANDWPLDVKHRWEKTTSEYDCLRELDPRDLRQEEELNEVQQSFWG